MSKPVPPEERRYLERNIELSIHDRRDDRDHGQERCTDIGDAVHHGFEIVGRTLAGTQTRDEAARVTQVVGQFLGPKLDRRPEVREEEHQENVRHFVQKLPREHAPRRYLSQNGAATCGPA
jgi:hypothetical protein